MKRIVLYHLWVFCILVSAADATAQCKLTLDKCLHRFDSTQRIDNSAGWSYWFVPRSTIADTLSVKVSHVSKLKGPHPPHTHFEDETFYVLKGPVRLHLNGEERVLQTGDHSYAPGNSSHSLTRETDETITYLMFKRETRGGLKTPFLPKKSSYSIDDCIVKMNESTPQTLPNGTSLWFVRKEFSNGLNVTREQANAGSSLEGLHAHAEQEIYFIVSGTAEVTFHGEKSKIGPWSSLYCPPHVMHEVRAASQEPLIYLKARTQ